MSKKAGPEPIRSEPAPKAEPMPAAASVRPAPAPEPTKTPPPAVTVTVQEVREAANALLNSNGQNPEPIKTLAAKYGAKRISEAPAEKFAEIVAELKRRGLA